MKDALWGIGVAVGLEAPAATGRVELRIVSGRREVVQNGARVVKELESLSFTDDCALGYFSSHQDPLK